MKRNLIWLTDRHPMSLSGTFSSSKKILYPVFKNKNSISGCGKNKKKIAFHIYIY